MVLQALNFMALLGVNVSLGVIATWLLPMRHPVIFMALVTCGLPLFSLVLASPVTMNVWNITGYIFNYAILPFLFWKAPRMHRFTCAVTLVFIEFLFEMLTGLIFVALDIPLDRNTGGLEIFVARCCNIALSLVVGRIAARVVAQTLGTGDDMPHPQRVEGEIVDTPRLSRSYLLFFLMQFAFIAQATMLLMTYRNSDPHVYLIMVALIVACFAVDAIALASWKRFAAAERARAHADELERQLADHLAAVRSMVAEVERAARFRHDERNHLQALGALVDQGEGERAASYAAELRRALATGGDRT